MVDVRRCFYGARVAGPAFRKDTPMDSSSNRANTSMTSTLGGSVTPSMSFSFVTASTSTRTVSGSFTTEEEAAVKVFTEPNFQGDHQVLEAGRYDVTDLTIPNDSVSSIHIPEGWRVTLFVDAGFSGEQLVIDASTEALSGDVDGTTSSIIVEELS